MTLHPLGRRHRFVLLIGNRNTANDNRLRSMLRSEDVHYYRWLPAIWLITDYLQKRTLRWWSDAVTEILPLETPFVLQECPGPTFLGTTCDPSAQVWLKKHWVTLSGQTTPAQKDQP